jgi:D-alanine-D-alanine ligase
MEERIVGRETTVAILDGEPLPVVEIRPKEGAYDYRNKYTAGRTEYYCPAPFDPELTGRVQAVGLGHSGRLGGATMAGLTSWWTERGFLMCSRSTPSRE